MTTTPAPAVSDEVYLEEHGVPGTLGVLAGDVGLPRSPELLQQAMWIAEPSRATDLHVGFRARFHIEEAARVTLRIQASSVFRLWLDGEVILHGPFRYAPSLPEYHEQDLLLESGTHALAIEAHDEGIMHRTTAPLPGFVIVALHRFGPPIELRWRARELDHYGQTGLRVSPLQGWIETHVTAGGWEWFDLPDDDPSWRSVVTAVGAQSALGAPVASAMQLPRWPLRELNPVESGIYSDTFAGFDLDDPAVQFLLADDRPQKDAPVDGQWFRYDLGCVRIGSFEVDLELEQAGTVIIGYAERLTPDQRPSPVVAMSAGPTRMIQRYAVGPGRTSVVPLQSLGARYVELRVETAGTVRVHRAGFRERDFLGDPRGAFSSADAVLDEIWSTGIRTLRSSTEDAIVDSVRERGEWLGDVVSVGQRIMQAGWSDTVPIRRALLHAAAGARGDGLVSGCGPGELIYLGTYAAQWVQACLDVAVAEGSAAILRELLEPARANMAAILASVEPDGTTTLPWGFVDWGYAAPTQGPDVAVLAHVVMAVRSWISWLDRLAHAEEAAHWRGEYTRLASMLRPLIRESSSPYHAHVLGYHAGIVSAEEAIPHIIERFENGFPFNPRAARLKNPTKADGTAVTPYFTNYSMPILLDAGRGELVRQLWHAGWGWMLDRGATTWWEVFDDRWSRCHYWSGAPTWQLSTYVLGLRPEEGTDTRTISVNTLGLEHAGGRIPLAGGGLAHVRWTRRGSVIVYTIRSTTPLTVDVGGETHLISDRPVEFSLNAVSGDIYA